MIERFVSERIEPLGAESDSFPAAPGEPILAKRFRWRNDEIAIGAILERWKSLGPASGGDRYVRRHWFRVRAVDGRELKLYIERQKPGARRRAWWIYSVVEPPV